MTSPIAKTVAAESVVRAANCGDADAIAEIYNQGIDDRLATFETEHRTAEAIRAWFDASCPVIVSESGGQVVAYAAAFPYRSRPCYAGVREFSVYVRRDHRGCGQGKLVLSALMKTLRDEDCWKLLSRIFPENTASRALCLALGFCEVGTYQRHGKLDGAWRDTIIVEKLLDT